MRAYGVIFEHKTEQPIIFESKPMTMDEARERMTNLLNDSRIIRVAIFEMKYVVGNESLIPKEEVF